MTVCVESQDGSNSQNSVKRICGVERVGQQNLLSQTREKMWREQTLNHFKQDLKSLRKTSKTENKIFRHVRKYMGVHVHN